MKVVLGQNNRGPSQSKPLKRYGGEEMLLEIESGGPCRQEHTFWM